jgi:hypothetical protein
MNSRISGKFTLYRVVVSQNRVLRVRLFSVGAGAPWSNLW